MEYPCHSPAEWRWFEARVAYFPADGGGHTVITHENITERKRLEDQLKHQTCRLAEALGQRQRHAGRQTKIKWWLTRLTDVAAVVIGYYILGLASGRELFCTEKK